MEARDLRVKSRPVSYTSKRDGRDLLGGPGQVLPLQKQWSPLLRSSLARGSHCGQCDMHLRGLVYTVELFKYSVCRISFPINNTVLATSESKLTFLTQHVLKI